MLRPEVPSLHELIGRWETMKSNFSACISLFAFLCPTTGNAHRKRCGEWKGLANPQTREIVKLLGIQHSPQEMPGTEHYKNCCWVMAAFLETWVQKLVISLGGFWDWKKVFENGITLGLLLYHSYAQIQLNLMFRSSKKTESGSICFC